mmetsp:Transcript_42452/g.123381  ORF Transcript_42452/g.123381 Transcript_42452/m.123381 type:complete len:86 (+) Transcript_42452:1171-1428(+)
MRCVKRREMSWSLKYRRKAWNISFFAPDSICKRVMEEVNVEMKAADTTKANKSTTTENTRSGRLTGKTSMVPVNCVIDQWNEVAY